MGLRLKLKEQPAGFLNCEPLSGLAGAGLAGLDGLQLVCGRKSYDVRSLWDVREDDTADLILEGDLSRCIRIGAGWKCGTLTVRSDTGADTGAGMLGGRIIIEGNVGDGACAGMQNGLFCVSGNAGHDLGYQMRRGVIVVKGNTASGAACDLLGGTLIILGNAALPCASGMNRGTVILGEAFTPAADLYRTRIAASGDALPRTFLPSGELDLTFLRLLFCMLEKEGISLPSDWYGRPFLRMRGDCAALGKGEVLIPC